ncbi:UDP-galactose transporter [Phycomyces nitens]|nr:UDP-galactose transporter [Phycomyces nitens]
MRYTRASVGEDGRYLASTAVLMSEIIKTLVCLGFLYAYLPRKQRSLTHLMSMLNRELIVQWRQSIKFSFPAILYLVQNNLQYIAATHLDAATFQVTYQLKILTTALFSVTMLHRSLSNRQWMALGLLTFGIGLVVLPRSSSASETGEPTLGNQSSVQGILTVMVACILSGLAGVYFEKIIKAPSVRQTPFEDEERQKESKKEDGGNAEASQLWIGNIQLSFFSVILGLVFVVALQDGPVILEKGFFANYNILTWVVIGIQASGGLIVALVVKHADSILKGFATSISILLSSLVSVCVFGTTVTGVFMTGALLVIYATYLYGLQ